MLAIGWKYVIMLLTFFLLTKTVLLQNADDGYAGLGWLKGYILLRMQLFSNPSSLTLLLLYLIIRIILLSECSGKESDDDADHHKK